VCNVRQPLARYFNRSNHYCWVYQSSPFFNSFRPVLRASSRLLPPSGFRLVINRIAESLFFAVSGTRPHFVCHTRTTDSNSTIFKRTCTENKDAITYFALNLVCYHEAFLFRITEKSSVFTVLMHFLHILNEFVFRDYNTKIGNRAKRKSFWYLSSFFDFRQFWNKNKRLLLRQTDFGTKEYKKFQQYFSQHFSNFKDWLTAYIWKCIQLNSNLKVFSL